MTSDPSELSNELQAARENEAAVDDALHYLIDQELAITPEAVAELVRSATKLPSPRDVAIDNVDLATYDALLTSSGDGAITADVPSALPHLS